MKLIIICVFYPPLKSSAAIQIQSIALELIRQGHSISVVTPDPTIKNQVQITYQKNLSVYRFKTGKLTDIPLFKRTINEILAPIKIIFIIMRQSIKLNNHDGIIFWSPSIFTTPLILFLKLINNCPSYLILRDLFPHWAKDLDLIKNKFVYSIFNIFFNWQIYISNFVGIQSEGNRKFIPKNILFKKTNIQILNNWYTPFLKKRKTKIDLKKTLLKNKKVLIYAGNIGIAQDLEKIIFLAEKIHNKSDIGFLFIGRGSQYQYLSDLTKKKRLKNVLFHKEIANNELEDLYKQCYGGIVILDRRHKTHNVPGKLISYLFSGLPVFAILNKDHDLINLINDNNVGYATDVYEINYLESKLEKFFITLYKNKNISLNCKTLANKEFNTSLISKQITESLRKF